MGGHKGYALSLMAELIGEVQEGPDWPEQEQRDVAAPAVLAVPALNFDIRRT